MVQRFLSLLEEIFELTRCKHRFRRVIGGSSGGRPLFRFSQFSHVRQFPGPAFSDCLNLTVQRNSGGDRNVIGRLIEFRS